jgi:hypothetical protein
MAADLLSLGVAIGERVLALREPVGASHLGLALAGSSRRRRRTPSADLARALGKVGVRAQRCEDHVTEATPEEAPKWRSSQHRRKESR